jgi:hypothetical protein
MRLQKSSTGLPLLRWFRDRYYYSSSNTSYAQKSGLRDLSHHLDNGRVSCSNICGKRADIVLVSEAIRKEEEKAVPNIGKQAPRRAGADS